MMHSKVHVIYIVMLFAFLGIINPGKVDAGIDFNINIGLPSTIMISTEPEIVLIPGTNTYIIPDIDVDIIFHNGSWYRPHKGYWYRANSYNGPWINLVRARIPVALLELPPDYRHILPGHARIPYGQLKKTWRDREVRYRDNNKHKNYKGKGKHRKH